MKRTLLTLVAAFAAVDVLAVRLDVDGPSASSINASNAADRAYADAVKAYCSNAGNLTGNVARAALTNALATLSAITYSGTNLNTNAKVADLFVATLTNSPTMGLPTGCYNGQRLEWWLTQGTGTNVVNWPTGRFVFPVGATNIALSTAPGATDVVTGRYWSGINKVRLTGNLRYNE